MERAARNCEKRRKKEFLRTLSRAESAESTGNYRSRANLDARHPANPSMATGKHSFANLCGLPQFSRIHLLPQQFSRKLITSLLSGYSHDTPAAVCMQSARRRIINLTNLGHRYTLSERWGPVREQSDIDPLRSPSPKSLIYNNSFFSLLNRNLGPQWLLLYNIDKSC